MQVWRACQADLADAAVAEHHQNIMINPYKLEDIFILLLKFKSKTSIFVNQYLFFISKTKKTYDNKLFAKFYRNHSNLIHSLLLFGVRPVAVELLDTQSTVLHFVTLLAQRLILLLSWKQKKT